MSMTVHTLKQCRPNHEETEYFWKLFHATQWNDARRNGSEISIIADELSRTDLDRNQKLFLLRSWQVLVDDKGGFGRFMGAFDTYVYNMQDPDDDCVTWKPELAKLLQDGTLFDVVLTAYQEACHEGIVNWEAATSLSEENVELKRKLYAAENRIAELEAEKAALRPDGYVIVPKRLTAENGAKCLLVGEFSETKFVNCPECFGDDECETCDGSGRLEINVPVTWTNIKEIWAKGVEHFSAAPLQAGEAAQKSRPLRFLY